MANKLTEAQQKVVEFDKGNLVVSASAGSGKTSVMIERIIRLLSEGKTDITKILCVTFTKLAAEEIKQKISHAFIEKIKNGEREKLSEQLTMLKTAAISTVDSFCSSLLRRYFYTVELDPTFSVLDATDAAQLKEKALENLFEKLFDDNDEDIARLVEIFLFKRSDKRLKSLVLELHNFSESEKEPLIYLNKCAEKYSKQGVIEASESILADLKQILQKFKYAYLTLKNDSVDYPKFYGYFVERENYVQGIIDSESLDEAYSQFRQKTSSKPQLKKDADAVLAELSQEAAALKAELDAVLKKYAPALEINLLDEINKAQKTRVVADSLINLVKKFSNEYSQMKRDLNALDYSDLEHFCYRVLQNEEAAKELQASYDYIFVDEYQDTNGIQEAIFERLEKNNLFIVGDVKQSIYSFRGCNSDIFQHRLDGALSGASTRIDLDDNFRSAQNVINSVNRVFSAIMTVETAKLDYSKTPMRGGKLYGEYKGEAQFYIIPSKEKQEFESLGVYSVKKHLEALNAKSYVERHIVKLIESEVGKKFYDLKTQTEREITYGDITVLTRKNKGAADRLTTELIRSGIPVNSQSKRSIGEYPEIKMMVNLVKFLVQPEDDIALATVLKSAACGLSDEQLKAIRTKFKDISFYEACLEFAKIENDQTAERLSDFFTYFERARLLAEFSSSADILNRIIEERGIEADILSGRLGEVKLNRVTRFINAGAQGNLTVFEFYDKLDNLLKGLTVSEVSSENAVRILSFHASKGLEFPVVILAEINDRFNLNDLNGEILFDRDEGLGLNYYDTSKRESKSSIIKEEIKLKKRNALITDEMRLFYVAMTRAKAKLFIVTDKEPIDNHRHTDFNNILSFYDFLAQTDMPSIYSESDEELLERERRALILSEPDEQAYKQISEYINFEYPYVSATKKHLKRTVSQLVSAVDKHDLEYYEICPLFEEGEDFSDINNNSEKNIIEKTNNKNEKALTASEKGTAVHRFLELLDFEKEPLIELERLFSEGKFSKEEYLFIKGEKIDKLFELEIFKKLSGYTLYREQPFIINYPEQNESENLLNNNSNLTNETNTVLLQGVIDLLAVKDDEAIIIDYKRSRLNKDELIIKYKPQVELYALAVERVLNKKVSEKYLLNLLSKEIIKV